MARVSHVLNAQYSATPHTLSEKTAVTQGATPQHSLQGTPLTPYSSPRVLELQLQQPAHAHNTTSPKQTLCSEYGSNASACTTPILTEEGLPFDPWRILGSDTLCTDNTAAAAAACYHNPPAPWLQLSPINDNRHLSCTIAIYTAVVQTGLPNITSAQIPVAHGINILELRCSPHGYADKQLCDFLEFGWPMNYTHFLPPTPVTKNHASATDFPVSVSKYIQ